MTAGVRPALVLGASLLAAGLAFASPSLLVPGIALVVLPVVLVAWARLSALGAGIRRAPVPARVVEGTPWELRISIRSGLLPLVATLVDPAHAQPVAVRCLRPRHELELVLEGLIPRRGRHRLQPPVLRLADPLGIASREISGGGEQTVLALPRTEPIVMAGGERARSPGPGLLPDALGGLSRFAGRDSPVDPDLDGLRPYRSGTPASRIYWPALARAGELMELRLTQPEGGGPLVVLDASSPVSPDGLDRAVRAAASLCFELARRGGCELLMPGSRSPISIAANLEAWPRAHAELALVEAARSAAPTPTLDGATALFWISAGHGPRIRLPASAGFVVTPAAIPGRRVVFMVAGCHAHQILVDETARARLAVAR